MSTQKKSLVLRLGGCLSIVASLGSLLIFGQDQLTEIYHASGFSFMFFSFLCWLYVLLPRGLGRREAKTWFGKHGWLLALVLLLAALMFLVSPLQFRILEDETNLLGVANSMFSNHSFANMTDTHYYAQAQHQVQAHWDIRPNFYPFLIYLVHCLRGYSAYNGFVVNFLAAAASLWSLHWLLRQWFSSAVALLGMLTLAACPVFVLWVTSSGFEIVNLCFSLLAFVQLHQYLKDRESFQLERLLLTLLLLAQVRYESAIFALAFGLVILISTRRASFEKLSLRLIAVPWFFLPVAWQRVLKSDKLDYQVYGEHAIFSLDNWTRHIHKSWDYFTGAEERYGTLGFVFYGALLGLALGLILLVLRRRQVQGSTWCMLAAAGSSLAALVAVVFGYYWGDLTQAFTIRLGIIFLPFQIFSFCFLLEWLLGFKALAVASGSMRKLALVAGLGMCLFYWPVASKNEAAEQLSLNRQYQATLEFLQREYPGHNNLIISKWPGMYSAHHWGSLGTEQANRMAGQISKGLEYALYQNVLAIQVLDYFTEQPMDDARLSARFKWESVFETQFDSASKVVISKLVPRH